jgi:8-oxo-dGTP diphosphatase
MTDSYPRFAVTCDAAVFSAREGRLTVLLIRRGKPPFKGDWAFPGGFVEIDEDLPDAAARELAEETGLEGLTLEQFHTFGRPGRDPRSRTVTVAYIGLLPTCERELRASDDAAEAAWFPAHDPPALAFDHNRILARALTDLRARDRQAIRRLLPSDTPDSAVEAIVQANNCEE